MKKIQKKKFFNGIKRFCVLFIMINTNKIITMKLCKIIMLYVIHVWERVYFMCVCVCVYMSMKKKKERNEEKKEEHRNHLNITSTKCT